MIRNGLLGRDGGFVMLLLSLAGTFASCSSDAPPVDVVQRDENAPKTVVLVVLDSLDVGHLKPYGYELDTMPRLSRFAETAVVFSDHITTSTGANASLSSILTGLYPRSHGVGSIRAAGQHGLPEEAQTLAEALRAAGFRTLAAVSLPQLEGGISGLDQGFEVYAAPPVVGGAETPASGARTRWTDEGLKAIGDELDAQLATTEPVFVMLELSAPRDVFASTDHVVPAFVEHHLGTLAREYPDVASALERFAQQPEAVITELVRSIQRRRGSRLREALANALYDSQLRLMDAELAKLFDALEVNGRLAGALVVVVGGRGTRLDEPVDDVLPPEALLRTALLIHVPWASGSSEVESLAQPVDVWPTIFRVLGRGAGGALDGIGLLEADGLSRSVASRSAAFHEDVPGGLPTAVSTSAVASMLPGPVKRSRGGTRPWAVRPRPRPGDRSPTVRVEEADRLVEALFGGYVVPEAIELALHPAPTPVAMDVRATCLMGGFCGSSPAHRAHDLSRGTRPDRTKELRLELRASGRAVEVQSLRCDRRNAPVRLILSTRGNADDAPDALPDVLDEELVWIGNRPLSQVALSRLASEQGEPWPAPGASTTGGISDWTVDVSHADGPWYQVAVLAAPGQAVSVRVETYPPGNLIEEIAVVAEAPVEAGLEPGLPGVARVSGTGPLTFRVKKPGGKTLGLSVALDGDQVPTSRMRYKGARYSRAGELALLLPEWAAGITSELFAAPAGVAYPPGALVIRRRGSGMSHADMSPLDRERLGFLHRLGGRE